MKIKAVRFTEPWKVACQDVEFDPELQSNQEVRVKNRASIISAGTEMACLQGIEGWFPLPGTPGYGACGIVQEVGAAVKGIQPGDRVYTYGPHAAEFRIDTTDRYHGLVVQVPDALPLDHAAFCRMAEISFAGIRTSNIELGDWVLVTGQGLVGNFAAQLAALQGGRVIAADVSPRRLELAAACGIPHQMNTSDKDWKEQVRALTGGTGVDVFIEATGLSAVLTDALDTVGMHGEAVLLGSPRAPFETNITDVYQKIHLPNFIALKGALEWRQPTWRIEFTKHSIQRNVEVLFHLLLSGKLVLDPLYTHHVRPEVAEDAYFGLRDQKDTYIGVVFDWA